jgi:hypothetical protein
MRSLCTNHTIDVANLFSQHVAVKKQNRIQRLVLCGGAYVPLRGETRKELPNLLFTHLSRVPFLVEKDESFDPMNVALFGFGTVMASADRLANLIEKFGSWLRCRQGAAFESTSVQWVYFGASHVVSSRGPFKVLEGSLPGQRITPYTEHNVIPESEAVLKASNQGMPVILDQETEAGQAYSDAVARLLGEDVEHRFLEVQKKGFFKRLLGGK